MKPKQIKFHPEHEGTTAGMKQIPQYPERALLAAVVEAAFSKEQAFPHEKDWYQRLRLDAMDAFFQYTNGLTTFDEFVNFLVTRLISTPRQ